MQETDSLLTIIYYKVRFPYRNNTLMGVAFFIILVVPLLFIPILTDGYELPKFSVLLISLAIGILILTKRSAVIRYNRALYVLFGLFVLQALVATIFSWDVGTSIFGLYARWTSSLLFYTSWIILIIIFLQAIDTAEQYWFLLRTAVLTAFAVSLFAIGQYFGFAFYAGLDAPVRSLIPSFMGNPNFAAMYVVALLPVAIWAYARSVTVAGRLYYVAVLGSSIVAIGLFNSRGAIAAAAFSGFILMVGGFVKNTHRRLAVTAIIVTAMMLLISGLLFVASRPQAIGHTIALSGVEISPRIVVIKRSAQFIINGPLVGLGPGNFYLAYEKYLNLNTVYYENFDDAHNIFLQTAVSVGLPMAILYLVIVLLGLWWGWKLWKQTRDPIYLVLGSAIISWHISASFNPVVIPCWILLALLLAGIYRHHLLSSVALPRPIRYLARMTIPALVIIAIALIMNDYLSLFPGNYYNTKQYNKAIRYAQAATVLNPFNNGAMRYWIRSRIQLNQGPTETARLIDIFYRIHPLSSRTGWNASVLYYKLYQQTNDPQYLQQAYDYSDKSIKIAPDFAALYFYTAFIHYQSKDYVSAGRYINQALAKKSDELSYWSLLAKIDQSAGDRDGTIRALEEAQKIQSASPAYKQVLQNAKVQPDVTKIQIPISFDEPDI